METRMKDTAMVPGVPEGQESLDSADRSPHRGEPRVFRGVLLALMVLLVPQFVLGMITNLYISFPHGQDGWSFALSQPVVAAHIYLGTLLVLLALAAVVVGIMTRSLVTVIASVLGFALLLFTWLSGDFFLADGQKSIQSVSMAFGFMAAFLVYAVAYYLTTSRTAG
jgi:hypothetical protein